MSGEIFKSPENFEDFDSTRWNPLHCYICKDQYEDPTILSCYHSYCRKCLLSLLNNGGVACPLCGKVSAVKESVAQLDSDPLLNFLVESSSADRIECANCDTSGAQMYFCNTCAQPLCVSCREETHKAKMFSRHEIVVLSKRTKDVQRECKLHNEPFILFSTEKRQLLCINCFRDMKIESRSHCVDLETAYKQGCKKLDDAMQSIRDLQHSVRDAILLLRALLEEVEENAEREKEDISTLFNTMQEKISETKLLLLQEVEKQYKEKEMLFKNQLVNLSTFLPTLHVHLVTCAAFSSTANKYEFLDFTYVLMERLKSIIQVQHPLHPSQGSDIVTDYKALFAKCLEPLLFPHRNGTTISIPSPMASSSAAQRLEISPSVIATVSNSVRTTTVVSAQTSSGGRRMSHNGHKFKHLDATGFFADHCKEFDDVHRDLMQKVEKLKLQTQELQRDLTLRRCLAKNTSVSELKSTITEIEVGLEIHHQTVEQKQPSLEQHWEESLEKLAREQEVYKAQIQDVMRLKQETQSTKTILQRLSSFVSSIANVTERIAPKLSKACCTHDHENQHQALLHEINTVQPDSQQRVDAIRTAQEERETKTANRTNPLDEELIKTKGLLRAPSARKDGSKRDSREFKDAVAIMEEQELGADMEFKNDKKSKFSDISSSNVKPGSAEGSKVKTGSSGKSVVETEINKTENVEKCVSLFKNSDLSVSPDKRNYLSSSVMSDESPTALRVTSPVPASSPGGSSCSSEESPKGRHLKTSFDTEQKVIAVPQCLTSPQSPKSCKGIENVNEQSADVMLSKSKGNSVEVTAGGQVEDVDSVSELSAVFTISFNDPPNSNTHTSSCDSVPESKVAKTMETEEKLVTASESSVCNGDLPTGSTVEEEDYVPKTLPELAQVFEPSEKPVRRKRHSKNESMTNK